MQQYSSSDCFLKAAFADGAADVYPLWTPVSEGAT